MTTTVYLSRDASAVSVGAEQVLDRLRTEASARGKAIRVVRNGSRGMFWLEPLVEIDTPAGRVGYGPVTPSDVGALLDSGLLEGREGHRLYLGLTEKIAYFATQQRLTFERVGVIDPVNLEDYVAHGGYQGLRRALELDSAEIVQVVQDSGLRGRGGAAFPTGIKWNTVLQAEAARKYVVCNADEGDSGTFADRMLMEGDPFVLIEGMTIAGLAVGATQGYIYLRAEYPHAAHALNEAIDVANQKGYLGADILGSGRHFDLEVRLGAGAYICGEETSMLESLEGRRGTVRFKPPLPAIEGLFGMPTVVNNVVSLASVPLILANGAEFYREFGQGRSRGTMPLQLAGNIKHGGIVERAFGLTLRELLYDYGGGSASGRPIRAVQLGGPLGAYLPESHFDTPVDYETLAAVGATLGHGGIVAFDDTVDMSRMARYAMEFCAAESCGKCTPCRIGAVRGVEVIDRLVQNGKQPQDEALLRDLCETMVKGSLCAMGGMTPFPVLSALDHFPQDFIARRDLVA